MDKETIIRACDNWVKNHQGEDLIITYSSVVELLTILKEKPQKTAGDNEIPLKWQGVQQMKIINEVMHWYDWLILGFIFGMTFDWLLQAIRKRSK